MNKKELKEKILELVSNDRMKEVFKLLGDNDDLYKPSKFNELMLLSARWHRLNKDNMQGIMERENFYRQRTVLIRDLLATYDIEGFKVADVELSDGKSNSVSFKSIKKVLKRLKNSNNQINYYKALEALSDLF